MGSSGRCNLHLLNKVGRGLLAHFVWTSGQSPPVEAAGQELFVMCLWTKHVLIFNLVTGREWLLASGRLCSNFGEEFQGLDGQQRRSQAWPTYDFLD